MQSIKIILILLSLYGIASTITFITYIVKYHNLQNECNLSHESDNKSDLPNTTKNEITLKDCEKFIYLNKTDSNNQTYDTIISKYDIYYDTDFYNKFDLIDDFNDKILIYSKDMKQCYKECENNNNCYGFSKYNNYCYLKGKYDLLQKNNASKITLILNPSKNLNP
jgi:hypothetical protein